MHFHENDVMRLLSRMPHLTLGKPCSAKQYISSLVHNGIELQAVLGRFPEVWYEPLDQHYAVLQCLSALSEELVDDLCSFQYSWHGVVSAAFLVVLAPDVRYRQYLTAARHKVPRHQWLVDLALAEIDQVTWNADMEIQTLAQHLRDLLSKVRAPESKVSLRSAPTEVELELLRVEREKVRRAYHSGGLGAAQKAVLETQVLRSRLANK